jgi:hypothetical protein
MKRAIVGAYCIFLFFLTPAAAAPGEQAQPQELDLTAFIDGKSTLCFTAKGVRWKHLVFSKPGIYEGQKHPTVINGKSWFPEWTSDDPRDEDISSVFPLNKTYKITGVKIISCSAEKNRAEIINRYELTFTPMELTIFDIVSGPHWYTIKIYVEEQ